MDVKRQWEARKTLFFGIMILILSLICYGVAIYTLVYMRYYEKPFMWGRIFTINQVESLADEYFRNTMGADNFLDKMAAQGLRKFLWAVAVESRRYLLVLGLLEVFSGLYLMLLDNAKGDPNACLQSTGSNWETSRCPLCGKRFAGRDGICPGCDNMPKAMGPQTTHFKPHATPAFVLKHLVEPPLSPHTHLRATFCPYCGRKNPSGARFCGGCGQRL